MILTTDKDFADAVKRGQKIKKQTIFYTGKLENVKHDDLKIGDYVSGKGVYAGILDGKQLFVAMGDNPKKLNYEEAIKFYENKVGHVPSLRELTQIWLYKDAINAGLKAAGGEELKEDDHYWSYTEYSAGFTWIQSFASGGRWGEYKYLSKYVRPVLAL